MTLEIKTGYDGNGNEMLIEANPISRKFTRIFRESSDGRLEHCLLSHYENTPAKFRRWYDSQYTKNDLVYC